MIEFTMPGGAKVAINPMLVFAVIENGERTRIHCAGGQESVLVEHPFDEVQRKLAAWSKA